MNSSRRLVFPALVAAGVFWGTTVPLSKVALTWLAPGWLAFARFALAAVVLMLVSRSRLRGACSPAVLLTGAVGYGGAVLLQNLGIQRTSVTHAALLIGATPVLVAIMAAALRHSVARPAAWAGFALSLAGVGLIAGRQGSGSSLGGDGLVLAAQLISAGFTVSQARLLRGRDPIAVTAVQLMAAAAAVLPFTLLTEAGPGGPTSSAALLAVIGLILAGTVLPTALFAAAQSKVSADVAGAFMNLEPLVGAAAGMALFGDPAGLVQLAGGAAILAGIGLSSFQVVRSERLRRVSVPARPGGVAVAVPDRGELVPAGAGAAGAGAAGAGTPGLESTGASATRSWLPPGEAPGVVRRTRWPIAWAPGSGRARRRLRPAARPVPRSGPGRIRHRHNRARRLAHR